jgi:hypothetical protein
VPGLLFGFTLCIIARMKSSSTKFLIAVTVVTIICASIQAVWNNQAKPAYAFQTGYVLLAIFSLSVTAIHLFLLSAAKGDPKAFIQKYLATTVFKFMFYILLLVVLLLFTEIDKRVLIVHYLFYYAVFTVMEVSFLYTQLQNSKK